MRGADSKKTVSDIILKVFKGSFISGKDIRIPVREGGEVVEIKVALTAAKDVLGNSAEEVIPAGTQEAEMTDEEKAQVIELLKKLGFEVK